MLLKIRTLGRKGGMLRFFLGYRWIRCPDWLGNNSCFYVLKSRQLLESCTVKLTDRLEPTGFHLVLYLVR